VPRENVKLAQQAIDAFNMRAVDVFAALTTQDFAWTPSMAAIDGEIFRGSEGIETYFGYLDDVWERFHILAGRFRERPDLVVMLGQLDARGKASGVPVDEALGMVFDVRDGKVSRIRGYLDHDEALRAAALAE
jgi:ketosteroid isomerase-like protein